MGAHSSTHDWPWPFTVPVPAAGNKAHASGPLATTHRQRWKGRQRPRRNAGPERAAWLLARLTRCRASGAALAGRARSTRLATAGRPEAPTGAAWPPTPSPRPPQGDRSAATARHPQRERALLLKQIGHGGQARQRQYQHRWDHQVWHCTAPVAGAALMDPSSCPASAARARSERHVLSHQHLGHPTRASALRAAGPLLCTWSGHDTFRCPRAAASGARASR